MNSYAYIDQCLIQCRTQQKLKIQIKNNIEMISQQMQRTPKINKHVESAERVVTSLGLYSNKKLESDSKSSSNSVKSIRQATQSKMARNQNQQDNKYTKPTKPSKENKNYQGFHQEDCEKSIDGYIVEEFEISSNNNQGPSKNIAFHKQRGQNIEVDLFANNYSINTNPKSTANAQQKNNPTLEPKQRQYQILTNKSKSNIVCLQSLLKEILKLNLLVECAEQQKQIRLSLAKLELQVRRLKLEVNEKKREDLKMKENCKKMQELRFLCSEQKIISNQLNIREIQTEELLSKHKLYADSMSIIFDQKQRQKQRIREKQAEEIHKQRQKMNYLYYQGQLQSVNRSSIKQNSMEMVQSYRYGEITEVDSQSQTYSDKFIKKNVNTNERQKSTETKANIINSTKTFKNEKNRQCRSRIKKSVSKVNILKMTDNSDNVSNHYSNPKEDPVSMSEISQIIHSSQGLKNISYTGNEDMVLDIKDRDQYQSYYEPNLTNTNTFNNTTPTINLNGTNNKKKQNQYKRLLQERIKILKSNIKFIKEDNQKKEQFLIQQKLCIKKNIQLFKLDTIAIEQQNRKINKIYFRKKLSSLSNSHEGGYSSNHNFRYKLLRSNQGRKSVTNSISKNSKSNKFRLKMRTERSQEHETPQAGSKLLYWNSYKQYQISTDRTLSGSSHKNLPINRYTLNKPQSRLSPKINEYRNSNIYTSRNIQTHALMYGSKPVYGEEKSQNYLINCEETPTKQKNFKNKIFVSSLRDQYYN